MGEGNCETNRMLNAESTSYAQRCYAIQPTQVGFTALSSVLS